MLYKTLFAIAIACCVLASCTKNTNTLTEAKNFKFKTVWNKSSFNAFTDLIYYNNVYYCAFREAKTHVSYDGKLRIVTSNDGNAWNSFALLAENKTDLRDPHFYIDNNGFLCIGANARKEDGSRQSLIFKLKNGSFTQPDVMDVDNDYYLWSFSNFKDSVYSIGYNVNQPCYNSNGLNTKLKISFFNNRDINCVNFKEIHTNNWINESFVCPSEASIVFTQDSNLITIVRDQDIMGYSHIGIAKYPFNKWEWKKFPYYIRGPKLALLPDGRLFLSGASLIDVHKTYYTILNPAKDFAIDKMETLPSDGDSGYPGVIVKKDSVLYSYYSSHEGNARVYIGWFKY